MKVLWLLNFLPAPLARALDLPVQASGSWVTALYQAMAQQPVEIILCAHNFAVTKTERREIGDTVYWAFPTAEGASALKKVLDTEQPELVQVFGTENDHPVWALETFDP